MNPSVEQPDDDNMAFSVFANGANAKAQKFPDFCHAVWVGVFASLNILAIIDSVIDEICGTLFGSFTASTHDSIHPAKSK